MLLQDMCFFLASIPFICFFLELLPLRNGLGMIPWLNALHDILANLVNEMRGFLQISTTNVNVQNTNTHVFFHCTDTFHLLHFRASEIKGRIRSDTLAKHLTSYFSYFSPLNESFFSNISHQ